MLSRYNMNAKTKYKINADKNISTGTRIILLLTQALVQGTGQLIMKTKSSPSSNMSHTAEPNPVPSWREGAVWTLSSFLALPGRNFQHSALFLMICVCWGQTKSPLTWLGFEILLRNTTLDSGIGISSRNGPGDTTSVLEKRKPFAKWLCGRKALKSQYPNTLPVNYNIAKRIPPHSRKGPQEFSEVY